MATEWISRDAVFAALELCAVLEHYQIEYKSGRGSSFRIHCPFHEDQRPSCSINSEQKVYHCFGCDAQGNVLDFIAAMEGLETQSEFRAVLETAIDIIGFNPSPPRDKKARGVRQRYSNNGQTNDRRNNTSNDLDAQSKSGESCDTGVSSSTGDTKSPTSAGKSSNGSRSEKQHGSNSGSNGNQRGKDTPTKLAQDKVIQKQSRNEVPPNKVLEAPAFPLKLECNHVFLAERGFDRELLDKFGIGYETRSNALMAGRICIPIHNTKGELVAYAGRWAGTDTNAEGEYIDSKDRVQERYKLPKGFAKQLELYNLHRVLRQLPKRKQRKARKLQATKLLVVEGFWSVLRLHSLIRSKQKTEGKKQKIGTAVIALMGRTISKQQIELLKVHGFQNIILMLDGDDEGRKATKAILPKLARHFFVKDACLPDGTKPDDVNERFLLKFVQPTKAQNPKGKLNSGKNLGNKNKAKKKTKHSSGKNHEVPTISSIETE